MLARATPLLLTSMLAHSVALVPPGYTAQPGDCGFPVCDTILDGQVHSRNLSVIASVCNRTPGCEGFNSNGWLKRCLPPRCPRGSSGLEPHAPSTLYTRIAPPVPVPPDAPVEEIEDAYYPVEEAAEAAVANVPFVKHVDASGCTLQAPGGGRLVSAGVGDTVLNWTVLAFVPAMAPVAVVMERRWRRWSQLVSASVNGDTRWDATLHKPLGRLELLHNAPYNLTGPNPTYFTKAANEPDDYLGQRILRDATHREASFLTAAKFLPPIADYVVLGDVGAPVKAVLAMDGKLLRSDGADNEPLRAGAPANCTSSEQCRAPPRDRSYCYQGACVAGGGVVFDASAFLDLPLACKQMQAGVLGGHLRVA